jgi:hypothetical protein
MRAILFYSLTFLCFLFSCKQEKEDLKVETPTEFIPLQAGKYITYKLDSLVFTQAGRAEETHTYQEKHVVDAQITDNLGRGSFRIFRFLRDSAGTQPWAPSGSYFITPLTNSIEISEDNQRIIKLVSPVKEGNLWKGNRFLGTEPYASKYTFSNDDNMGDWEFIIENANESLVINGTTIENVVTISSIDESLNVPIVDAASFAARSLSIDKFAKNIGLVYQEYILWEYQPNPGSSAYKIGFGVKRTMIDRN